MTVKHFTAAALRTARAGVVATAIFQLAIGNSFAANQPQTDAASHPETDNSGNTTSPIKHVIVIIGENRSFDHVFATYVPPRSDQKVFNLLSEGIINADGSPGANFAKGAQNAATDLASDAFLLSPPPLAFNGGVLPAPLNGGPVSSYVANDSLTLAQQSENGLPPDYYGYLVTGGSGLSGKVPDTRITNVNALPAGPFQLTNGDTLTYNDYAASPVHRFYQMWQQLDCSIANAPPDNPSGCDAK